MKKIINIQNSNIRTNAFFKMMGLFFTLTLTLFNSIASADSPCPYAGQRGCPTTFRAGTMGCNLCEKCNKGGGTNHYTDPDYYCSSRFQDRKKVNSEGVLKSQKIKIFKKAVSQ
jgi:hypothetical protein